MLTVQVVPQFIKLPDGSAINLSLVSRVVIAAVLWVYFAVKESNLRL
jgi:hypothetical protein